VPYGIFVWVGGEGNGDQGGGEKTFFVASVGSQSEGGCSSGGDDGDDARNMVVGSRYLLTSTILGGKVTTSGWGG